MKDRNPDTTVSIGTQGQPPLLSEPLWLEDRQFRVLGRIDRLNREGQGCTRLELGCLAGAATAVLRHSNFLPHQRAIQHGDIVRVSGELRTLNDRRLLKVDSLHRCDLLESLRPTALLPADWVLPHLIPNLRRVTRYWNSIYHPAVQALLSAVFRDASTAMGFLNVPGSMRHHHAYQGGLLVHTAEMLEGLCKYAAYRDAGIRRDIAIALIILHDIGKTVTLVGSEKERYASCRGAIQPHDMAALEMLAVPLARLETKDASIANLIRGYFRPRYWHPKNDTALYQLVSSLDRETTIM